MNSSKWLLVCLAGFSSCQESVFTQIDPATTQTYGSGEVDILGTTMTFKDTTLTITATTSSQAAETQTRNAETRTFTALPTVLATVQDINAANDIENYASTLTTLGPAQVASAVADLEAYYSSLQPDTPYIIYKAPKDLMDEFSNDGLDQNTYVNVVLDMMDPWNASHTADVASLLAQNPSLSSEVLEYMSVAQTFMVSSLSVVGSIVTKDLSLTGTASTWVSKILAATATTTSSSSGVMPTVLSGALSNAGAIAAGVAVLVERFL